MKLETEIHFIRFAFNAAGNEYANLGAISVCDQLSRADIVSIDDLCAKSRADCPIDRDAAAAFLRMCQQRLHEAAEKRKSAIARGDTPWAYSALLGGMREVIKDPPFDLSSPSKISTEVQETAEGTPAEPLDAVYVKLLRAVVGGYMAPKIVRRKSRGLILPGNLDAFLRRKDQLQ